MHKQFAKKGWYVPLAMMLFGIVFFGHAQGSLFGLRAAFGYGGGGGSAPKAYQPPPELEGGFSVAINDGNQATSSRLVTLSFNGGSQAVRMAISNSPDFSGSSQEPYRQTGSWMLSEGEGTKAVYVRYYDRFGAPSRTVSDTIRLTSASVAEETADVNGDNAVDVLDFNSLMVQWGRSGAGLSTDLNRDGSVDILDFNLLMVYWTT